MGFRDEKEFWEPWCIAFHESEPAAVAFAARLGEMCAVTGVATAKASRGRGLAAQPLRPGHGIRGSPAWCSATATIARTTPRVVWPSAWDCASSEFKPESIDFHGLLRVGKPAGEAPWKKRAAVSFVKGVAPGSGPFRGTCREISPLCGRGARQRRSRDRSGYEARLARNRQGVD